MDKEFMVIILKYIQRSLLNSEDYSLPHRIDAKIRDLEAEMLAEEEVRQINVINTMSSGGAEFSTIDFKVDERGF